MATSSQLGTFSYDMILSYAKFEDALTKAQRLAEKQTNAITGALNRSANSVKDGLSDIAGKFLAAFAVDRLIEFGRHAIETADQVGKMAQKVGISTESLSALSVQAGLSDVGIESLQGGLTKLAKNSAAAATGNKDLASAFQKMGLDIKDSSGHLKNTDTLLGEVAAKFAGYEDSAEKTALAQKLFGKSGAELIPLLNELGTRGFAAVREEAEKYGAVISGDAAKAAETFNDNLTRLKLEAQGFANAVTQALLPALNKLTTDMVQAGTTTDRYASSASTVVNAIKGIVLAFAVISEAVKVGTAVLAAFYDVIATSFKASAQFIIAWASTVKEVIVGALTLDGDRVKNGAASFFSAIGQIGTEVQAKFKAVGAAVSIQAQDSVAGSVKAWNDLFGAFSNVAGGAETTAGALKKTKAPLVDNEESAKKAKAANDAYAASLASAAQAVTKLHGEMGPLSKAYADYVAAIAAANAKGEEIREKAKEAGKALEGMAMAQAHVEEATEAASDALAKNIAKIEQSSDVVGRYIKNVQSDAALIGLTDRQKAITMAIQDQQTAWGALSQEVRDHAIAIGQLDPTSEKGKAAIAGVTAALYDQQKAFDANKAAAEQFQGIFTSAAQSIADALGQLFTGQIKSFKDFGKTLLSIAKQMVAQLISQFIQLKVLGPILSGIFGGASQSFGGALAGFAGAAAGGGGGGSGWDVGTLAQLAGYGGVGGGGSGIGGAAYNLFMGGGSGAGSAFQAGQSFWGGFENAFSSSPNAASNMFGAYTPDYGAGTYAPSTLGYVAAGAAGLYAGYNRYQQSNGGVAGLAGAAAYGYGTYAATIGVGAAATGGIAAGVAAIPVVGWIALAAMLIDKFSGGKLFGTKGEVKSGVSTLNIGPGGADYSTFLALKGQKALFGGAKWSTENIAQTPEEKAAAMAYFDNVTKAMTDYAEATGGKVGDLVAAAFGQQFDKHGNLTGITSATIAGHTYENATAEQFNAGYIAANQLAVLSQFDDALNATVDTYRENIDEMVSVANGLTGAQIALKSGAVFLGTGTDQTLSAILKLAEGMQGAGEMIGDTINRILQAQAQYDQFVAQFKPAATFTSDFEAALASINAQLQANIAQANALAKAAGAEHAATQDLVNIHKYAAAQFAAAVSQLKASANSLAAQLGYALPQSLDDINAQIAELESAAQGAGSIQNFGNAMTDAANRAKAGIDLLLGSLSPLNDQAKLQVALQGLRAGTTTPEQVLEIGRRLYASTQAYKDLFAMVQQFGRGGGAGGGGGGGSGLGGQTGGDSARLAELKAQRDALEAAKRHEDAQILAQKIADLAAATGISIDEALAQVGIKDVAPFIKDLGLQSRADFDKLILQLEANTDSAGENVSSLADKITTTNDLLNDILIAVGGHSSHPTPDASPDAPNNSAPGSPRGHGGHGRPMTPDEMRDAVAAGTQDGFIRGGGAIFPRSSRQPRQ